MKRLVIIEDQTAIREMLVEILRMDPNYKLVGESGDGQSAYTLCIETKPDLLVLDAQHGGRPDRCRARSYPDRPQVSGS